MLIHCIACPFVFGQPNCKLHFPLCNYQVHVYRPWTASSFIACLPKSVKRVAVIDITHRRPSNALYLDVLASVQQASYVCASACILSDSFPEHQYTMSCSTTVTMTDNQVGSIRFKSTCINLSTKLDPSSLGGCPIRLILNTTEYHD